MNSILSVPPWFIRDGKLFCYSSFIANSENVSEPQTEIEPETFGIEPATFCGFGSRLGLKNSFWVCNKA